MYVIIGTFIPEELICRIGQSKTAPELIKLLLAVTTCLSLWPSCSPRTDKKSSWGRGRSLSGVYTCTGCCTWTASVCRHPPLPGRWGRGGWWRTPAPLDKWYLPVPSVLHNHHGQTSTSSTNTWYNFHFYLMLVFEYKQIWGDIACTNILKKTVQFYF